MTISRRRTAMLGAAALALALTATACSSSKSGSGGASNATVSASDVQNALDTGGTITVWSWEPTLKKVVTDFQTKYPKVHVNLVNAGTGNDEYKALQNAVKAGKGVPDVAHIEYFALPQFALTKSLTDLTPYGAATFNTTFTPGPWNAVHAGGSAVYGLPMDSGPVALFYNKTVFDKDGITTPPATWDEYIADAKKIHAADPDAYIGNDAGDSGFTTSLIWQAGGRPYTVNGTTVGINFADAGTQKVAAAWQQLLDGHLLAPISSWSDDWYKGLGDGSIASLTIGAWMPASLESGVKAGSGQWRVAPMPQWDAGAKVTSENGGSSLAVMQAGANKTLAYAFLKYATVDEGAQTRTDNGAFPATTKQLNSPDFLNKAEPYFGGQQINQILAASASEVAPGWNYLPFQVYANSIFSDTVGKAYTGGTTLQAGLKAWQDASIKYGTDQGFTMK